MAQGVVVFYLVIVIYPYVHIAGYSVTIRVVTSNWIGWHSAQLY